MTRAVLDTNTWVSGLGWGGGPPGDVVEGALAGRFEIVTSPALLDELRRVLAYPKLAEMFGDVDEVVELIALASHVVRPTLRLDLVRDPDDNRVLEAAITGSADVTTSTRSRGAVTHLVDKRDPRDKHGLWRPSSVVRPRSHRVKPGICGVRLRSSVEPHLRC